MELRKHAVMVLYANLADVEFSIQLVIKDNVCGSLNFERREVALFVAVPLHEGCNGQALDADEVFGRR